MRMLVALGFGVSHFAAEFKVGDTLRRRLEGLGVSTVCPPQWPSAESFLKSEGKQFAAVVLSMFPAGATFYPMVRRYCPQARIIFNAGDMHHVRMEREARISGDTSLLPRAQDARQKEEFLVRNTDATIVVSDVELQHLRRLVPEAHVAHVPLIRDMPGRINGFHQRANIGFVGYFLHAPNPDAVLTLVSSIWPRVRAALPDVHLRVIGAHWPRQIPAPAGNGIEMVGHVPDLTAALERLRLTVAPLRFGAGAKGKVVSSLAHGVPCVATSIAAEGMGLIDGVELMIAKRNDRFAEKIVSLYSDEALWTRISDAGLAAVKRQHSFEHGMGLIAGMLQNIGVTPSISLAS
jgi:glycosyltransferase involved in cell wall biosynthesis